MKLFKSSILAVLALGAALTSCNETSDVTYVPGAQDPGAFFASNIETAIVVAEDATSAEIQINRTSDLITEANISAVDDSKLFTIPGTVVFDEGKGVAPLTITFDPNKLELGKSYPVKLSIANASNYGQGVCEFVIIRGAAATTEKFGEGTGSYTFGNYWSGTMTDVPVYKTYNPNNPDKDVVITFKNILPPTEEVPPTDITIHIADMTPDEDGNVNISVEPVYVLEDNNGKVYYTDAYTWLVNAGRPDLAEQFKGLSTYNVNTGLFTIMSVYYLPEKGATASYGQKYEYLQMDGFPNYEVSVTYNGFLSKPDGSYQALATVVSGEDVATVRAGLVFGDDVELLIKNLTGEDDSKYVEFEGGSEKEVRLSFEEAGTYTLGAVTFDAKGEAQKLDYTTFEVAFSNDNADWTSLGNTDFGDGWVLSAYLKPEYTVLDALYAVELQQNKKDASLYRLVAPWGSVSPLADYNKNPRKRNLEFTVGTKTAFVQPQETGFADEDGDYSVCNYEGRLKSLNPDASEAAILATLEKNSVETTAIVKDEDLGTYIEVPVCLFDQGNTGKWYTWKSDPHAYIFMPDATANVKAKVTARNIARPAKGSMLKSLRRASKARRANVTNLHIPVLTNKVKAYSLKAK